MYCWRSWQAAEQIRGAMNADMNITLKATVAEGPLTSAVVLVAREFRALASVQTAKTSCANRIL
jgi:hypothetical protein